MITFQQNFHGDVDNLQNEAKKHFEDNEIYKALTAWTNGFIGVLTEPSSDFVINWKDVNYLDNVLIPAGNINFSQLCRDNEVLGKVKEYVNIILSALLGFNLIANIWNLLLSTLGIDNPFLYELDKESTVVSVDSVSGVSTLTKRIPVRKGFTIIRTNHLRNRRNK